MPQADVLPPIALGSLVDPLTRLDIQTVAVLGDGLLGRRHLAVELGLCRLLRLGGDRHGGRQLLWNSSVRRDGTAAEHQGDGGGERGGALRQVLQYESHHGDHSILLVTEESCRQPDGHRSYSIIAYSF